MKQLFIAGNWKSNKTIGEAKEWLAQVNAKCQMLNAKWENVTIVICAPFTALQSLNQQIEEYQLPISLSAQNISQFEEGAYTGEVSARMIKEVADWVLIGHSERRRYFHESDEILAAKTQKAQEAGLKVIYCVPDDKTAIPPGVDVIAYEPVWAIGTGKTDTPENANSVIASIKQKTGVKTVIYGGSVSPANVAAFLNQPAVDGVLPGAASLDPEKFSQLLYEAKKYT